MLTAVAVLLAAGAAFISGRWYLLRVDAIGRRVGFPGIWVGLLTVLALLAAYPGVVRSRLEDRLSRAASTLAGRPVRVRCQAMGGAFVDAGAELGYVKYRADGSPVDWTLIKRDQCNDLAGYLGSDKRNPGHPRVLAVHIVAHEAMHLAAITDEAAAECAAMQRDAQAARLLGASRADAAALARRYHASIYPRMSSEYRSSECVPGGRLDEALGDGPWEYGS